MMDARSTTSLSSQTSKPSFHSLLPLPSDELNPDGKGEGRTEGAMRCDIRVAERAHLELAQGARGSEWEASGE